MVENIDTTNIQKKDNTGKSRPYDPILDDPISSGDEKKKQSSDSEGSGSSSEEEVEIEFPRENGTDLLNFIHRELTNIQNMEDP